MSVVTDPARPATRRFDAIGAPWAISTPQPLAADVVRRIDERIASFDATWSRFRDDSLVAEIAVHPGAHELPPEAGPLLDLYRRLDALTGGSVSPLVGRRLEHLGYDRDYSLRVGPGGTDPAAVPRWDDAVEWDGRVLTTSRPVLLDVGAAGKGYLVDLICAILDEAGHDDYVVDASGDLRQRGQDPARVALEDPSDPTMAIGVVELSGRALCASATNRRTWGEGLHHVIDATTGLPTADVVATWAIAPTALEADGLATALFFTDPVELAREFDLEAVRVFADGSAQYTTNFSGDLF
jgi:thiamine biosynthesis lipoprotein